MMPGWRCRKKTTSCLPSGKWTLSGAGGIVARTSPFTVIKSAVGAMTEATVMVLFTMYVVTLARGHVDSRPTDDRDPRSCSRVPARQRSVAERHIIAPRPSIAMHRRCTSRLRDFYPRLAAGIGTLPSR